MPFCTKCNSVMVLRTARKGPKADSQFWGCSRFPSCRGTRNLNEGIQTRRNQNLPQVNVFLPRKVAALIRQNLGILVAASLIAFTIFLGSRYLEIFGRNLGRNLLTAVPTVTDGDTIRMGQNRIRLYGLDAPESDQTCRDSTGDIWYCGASATEALRSFVDGSQIECKQMDTDRYGRIVAVCYKDGTDLNAWMVRNGWAVAYRRYSMDYVGEEAAARNDGLGIWSGNFMNPEDWRRRN